MTLKHSNDNRPMISALELNWPRWDAPIWSWLGYRARVPRIPAGCEAVWELPECTQMTFQVDVTLGDVLRMFLSRKLKIRVDMYSGKAPGPKFIFGSVEVIEPGGRLQY